VEALGTATLIDGIPKQRAVTASVSRDQIADVLSTDGTPELHLDLSSADGSEHATVCIEWTRDDLERLLASAAGDVTLTFDADELVKALDDVEAHGVRTRAAIFAVAAVGALGAGSSIANAAGQGAAADAAAAAALQIRSEAMDQQFAGNVAATDALQARSEAMNEAYGLDSTAGLGSSDSMSRDDALLGGVLLLTIAGATFAVRRTGPPRPA
jgi:hypothetical protein